jgi:tetratricopeptide (TPR) repeat protein
VKLGKSIIAAALAVATTCAFADALTDRAKQLMRDRQHKQAYDLLLPQEPNRAGDPEFDYLLGIAALDAGDPERAIFALERVLAMQPNNHVARAEIARAYLAVGEREAARREFQTVREQRIPEEAKQSVDRYLSAIAAADVTQVQGYFEIGVGHDSNVNSATSDSRIALPGLGGIIAILDPRSTEEAAGFGALAGGVNITHKLSESFAVVGAGSASAKIIPEADQFNTTWADGSLGGRWTVGKEAITLGVQGQTFSLAMDTYRQTAGFVAQWQHNFSERHQLSLFGQALELHYPDQSIRDVDRGVAGIAWGRALEGNYSPVIFASVYAGAENEQAEDVPHLGHELAGVRLGGQVRVRTGLSLFASLSYEQREYGGVEPVFLVEREDKQTDLTVGLSALLRPGTTLIAQYAYTDNSSNIVISDFDRNLFSVSMRFNF